MIKDLLDEYIDKFGEVPPKIITTNYEDDIYIKLMEIALHTGKKITMEQLSDEFDKVEYDLAEE